MKENFWLILMFIISFFGIAWILIRMRMLKKLYQKTIDVIEGASSKKDEELLDFYFGPKGSELRESDEIVRRNYPSRTAMGSVLFKIHTHGELCKPDEIVYEEKEIIKLLEFLGYPVKFGDEKSTV